MQFLLEFPSPLHNHYYYYYDIFSFYKNTYYYYYYYEDFYTDSHTHDLFFLSIFNIIFRHSFSEAKVLVSSLLGSSCGWDK